MLGASTRQGQMLKCAHLEIRVLIKPEKLGDRVQTAEKMVNHERKWGVSYSLSISGRLPAPSGKVIWQGHRLMALLSVVIVMETIVKDAFSERINIAAFFWMTIGLNDTAGERVKCTDLHGKGNTIYCKDTRSWLDGYNNCPISHVSKTVFKHYGHSIYQLFYKMGAVKSAVSSKRVAILVGVFVVFFSPPIYVTLYLYDWLTGCGLRT